MSRWLVRISDRPMVTPPATAPVSSRVTFSTQGNNRALTNRKPIEARDALAMIVRTRLPWALITPAISCRPWVFWASIPLRIAVLNTERT